MKYNGFEKDIELFAKFVFWYESSIKNKLKKEKDFKYLLPKSQHKTIEDIKKFLVLANAGKKHNTDFFSDESEQLHLLKGPIIVGFCYHLRNAICHNGLQLFDDKIQLIDRDVKTKNRIKGFVNYNCIIAFLKALVAIYEQTQE